MRLRRTATAMLVLLLIATHAAAQAADECRRDWARNLPPIMVSDGAIYDTAVWDDGTGPVLYAVGFFALQDASGWADGVARWTGTSWEPVGGGVGYTTHTGYPEVHAVDVYNGKLIIAGDFTRAGNVPANNIVTWDGTRWAPLGQGFNEIVYSLGHYDGKLVAGTDFGAALWDGAAWSWPGGTTLGGTVSAITVYNGELVVGGSFSAYVGGTLIQYLARFDGHAWSPVGTGVNGTVNALATYNGELIVGGYLWSAGGVSVGNIARWNGANWAPLVAGEGPNGPVYALAEYEGALMVGGSFWSAGNVIAGLVARWNADGSGAWSGLRNGLNRQGLDDFVFDFSVLDGDLVASGRFPPNAGHSSGLVDWARWACSTSPNQAPIAYAGGPFSGLRGHWMSFNGNASSDPDADLLRYEWDFGDGSTATMLSALASHSYAATGIFTLTLVVHDGELASAPYTTTVTITAPNVAPTVTLTNPAPGAAFTAPATIALAATASDSDGSVTEVEFFNDTISLGIDTSAPYAITWSNVQAGRCTINRPRSGQQRRGRLVFRHGDCRYAAAGCRGCLSCAMARQPTPISEVRHRWRCGPRVPETIAGRICDSIQPG